MQKDLEEEYVMKVRVRFSKEGAMKFIGHLDIMRYFQKAIRRAGLDIAFSEGFNPHMIMSFAAPLGVGITSTGEYFDMELKTAPSSLELVRRLNAVMADGMQVLSCREVPEGKGNNAMSLVAAADYRIGFREGKEPPVGWQEKLSQFLAQPEILVMKKTKKGEKELDIRPLIYQMELLPDQTVFLQLSAGSAANIKPELVFEAFYRYLGASIDEFALLIHRLETYADCGSEQERKLVSLEELGNEIV